MTNPFFDEERCLADTDPAKLVPRVITLIEDDPDAEKLPSKFISGNPALYGEHYA